MTSTRPILKHYPRYMDGHRPPALSLTISSESSCSDHTQQRSASTAACAMSPSTFPFASTALNSPHVHFPPTPSMACIHPTHSPTTYDRAPIVVLPNSCSLPERGGRMYHAPCTPGLPARRLNTKSKAGYFDAAPSDSEASEVEDDGVSDNGTSDPLNLPALLPDLTSESESDGYLSPEPLQSPPRLSINVASPCTPVLGAHGGISFPRSPYPLPLPRSQEEFEVAMGFLPHAGEEKRLRDRGKQRHRGRTNNRHPVFMETSLDGCLGGF